MSFREHDYVTVISHPGSLGWIVSTPTKLLPAYRVKVASPESRGMRIYDITEDDLATPAESILNVLTLANVIHASVQERSDHQVKLTPAFRPEVTNLVVQLIEFLYHDFNSRQDQITRRSTG